MKKITHLDDTILIKKIKEKSTLKNISNQFLKKHIQGYIKINNPNLTKKSQYKALIKEIRRKANLAFGMFQTKEGKNLPLLLRELKKNPDSLEFHDKVLMTSKSTRERLDSYPDIYKRIIKDEKSILDIGCGLNPFSYPYIKKEMTYYAYDLYTKPIKEYFKIKKIKGKVKDTDLTNQEYYLFPKADVCFLFKLLDSLESKDHKKAELLIKSIPSKKIIVSFPLKTLKNKVMTTQERKWIYLLCKRLNYSLDTFKTENEVFYIIEKHIN